MRQQAIEALQEALEQANKAERHYYELQALAVDVKKDWDMKQAELLLSGQITGKNEEQREAQVIEMAKPHYLSYKIVERNLNLARADYYNAKRVWETRQLIVQIMLGELEAHKGEEKRQAVVD